MRRTFGGDWCIQGAAVTPESASWPPFTVPLSVVIRRCREDDLPALEWFGLFAEHRAIIRSAYESQERGEAVMLLAEAGGFPIGQVWINLIARSTVGAGALWAVRVFPAVQNLGIGARLIAAAEQVLREKGFSAVELGVERDNPRARRFYERLGYRAAETVQGEWGYTAPDGTQVVVPLDEWMMRKDLEEPS